MKRYVEGQVHTNAEAHAAKLSAKKLRHNVKKYPDRNPDLVVMDVAIAGRLENAADAHLKLEEMPERGAGGELVPIQDSGALSIAVQTVKSPDRVTVDASLDRVDLAHKNGVLNMALDTAEALNAQNSAEQMLAHQMAAAHRMSLDLMAQAGNTRDPIEKCRLVNASARLMDVCQKTLLTIDRLHTGGQQTVTVQHVQVTGGGQAVINGTVQTGGAMLSKLTTDKS